MSEKSQQSGPAPTNTADNIRQSTTSNLAFLLYNFTRTDIKTVVIPQAVFGLAGALCGPPVTAGSSSPPVLLSRVPLVVLWLWLNLLVFTLANQRLPSSIIEDSHNKPWRNIPSGYITVESTRRLLLVVLLVSWALSTALGTWTEFAALGVLIWMYNDLGGAEEHFLVRNVNNALGYFFYGLGALRIAATGGIDTGSSFSPVAYWWSGIVAAAIATTIQVQDLQDQEGDRARGRRTFPLVLGDSVCRWSVAISVIAWSMACPFFWELGFLGYAATVSVGSIIAARVLLLRGEPRWDERTFAVWCAWLGLLYLLPVGKRYGLLV
jgi:4-hydroxybenzoate polyprenyltransferase